MGARGVLGNWTSDCESHYHDIHEAGVVQHMLQTQLTCDLRDLVDISVIPRWRVGVVVSIQTRIVLVLGSDALESVGSLAEESRCSCCEAFPNCCSHRLEVL